MESEPVFFRDRSSWRTWLRKNHGKCSEVWVLTFKKHTGRKCLSYDEALEEALCYGWIDSRLKRIDDERHMWRFAPRKPDSIWSTRNRGIAERLIAEGRMTAHGMAKIEAARRSGNWERHVRPSKVPRIPKDLKDALVEDDVAWTNFQAFAKSYRHAYIGWVAHAKRPETREKRIQEVVRRARENIKQFMG
jgi:uncharacterized protein YdeI (YjbR/CyaY-like superfamily)